MDREEWLNEAKKPTSVYYIEYLRDQSNFMLYFDVYEEKIRDSIDLL